MRPLRVKKIQFADNITYSCDICGTALDCASELINHNNAVHESNPRHGTVENCSTVTSALSSRIPTMICTNTQIMEVLVTTVTSATTATVSSLNTIATCTKTIPVTNVSLYRMENL